MDGVPSLSRPSISLTHHCMHPRAPSWGTFLQGSLLPQGLLAAFNILPLDLQHSNTIQFKLSSGNLGQFSMSNIILFYLQFWYIFLKPQEISSTKVTNMRSRDDFLLAVHWSNNLVIKEVIASNFQNFIKNFTMNSVQIAIFSPIPLSIFPVSHNLLKLSWFLLPTKSWTTNSKLGSSVLQKLPRDTRTVSNFIIILFK